MPKRILIECTPTYTTAMVSGIQRVVINLINHSVNIQDAEIHTVIFVGNKIFALSKESLSATKQEDTNHKFKKYCLGLMQSGVHCPSVIKAKDVLRLYFSPLFKGLKQIYLKLLLRSKLGLQNSGMNELFLSDNDILVMADANWGRDSIWPQLEAYRAAGVKIIFIFYDLIPIRFPEFCGETRRYEFEQFVIKMLQLSDGVLSISKSVQTDLMHYISETNFSEIGNLPKLDYFYLGVDFKSLSFKPQCNQLAFDAVFDASSNVYLSVSTIEPRKNHAYLLDAFDILWRSGCSSKLVIVGRVGWMVSQLVDRIQSHPQFNKKLFMFNSLDDSELVYCYQQSTALIFPSVIEGFGLPIIEALHYRLPVIASDIAVHREIGQDKVMYVDLNSPLSLVNLLSSIEKNGIDQKYLPDNFEWLDWQEATENFCQKVNEVAK